MTPGQTKDPRKDPLITYKDLKKKKLLGKKNSSKKTSRRKKTNESYSYEGYKTQILQEDPLMDLIKSAAPWVAGLSGLVLAGLFMSIRAGVKAASKKARAAVTNSDDALQQLTELTGVLANFKPSEGSIDKNDRATAQQQVSKIILETHTIRWGTGVYQAADGLVMAGVEAIVEKKGKEESAKAQQQGAQQGASSQEGSQETQQQGTTPQQGAQPTSNPAEKENLQQNSMSYLDYKSLITEEDPNKEQQAAGSGGATPTQSQNQTPDASGDQSSAGGGEGEGATDQSAEVVTVEKSEIQNYITKEFLSSKKFTEEKGFFSKISKEQLQQFKKMINELFTFYVDDKPFSSKFLNERLELILEGQISKEKYRKELEKRGVSEEDIKLLLKHINSTPKSQILAAFKGGEKDLEKFIKDRKQKIENGLKGSKNKKEDEDEEVGNEEDEQEGDGLPQTTDSADSRDEDKKFGDLDIESMGDFSIDDIKDDKKVSNKAKKVLKVYGVKKLNPQKHPKLTAKIISAIRENKPKTNSKEEKEAYRKEVSDFFYNKKLTGSTAEKLKSHLEQNKKYREEEAKRKKEEEEETEFGKQAWANLDKEPDNDQEDSGDIEQKTKQLKQKIGAKLQKLYNEDTFTEVYQERAAAFLEAAPDKIEIRKEDKGKSAKQALETTIKKSLSGTLFAKVQEYCKPLGVKVEVSKIQGVLNGKAIFTLSEETIKSLFDVLYQNNNEIEDENREKDFKRFSDCASGKVCHLEATGDANTEILKDAVKKADEEYKKVKKERTDLAKEIEAMTAKFEASNDKKERTKLKEDIAQKEKILTRKINAAKALRDVREKAKEALKADANKRKGILGQLFDAENITNLKQNLGMGFLNKVGGAVGIGDVGDLMAKKITTS